MEAAAPYLALSTKHGALGLVGWGTRRRRALRQDKQKLPSPKGTGVIPALPPFFPRRTRPAAGTRRGTNIPPLRLTGSDPGPVYSPAIRRLVGRRTAAFGGRLGSDFTSATAPALTRPGSLQLRTRRLLLSVFAFRQSIRACCPGFKMSVGGGCPQMFRLVGRASSLSLWERARVRALHPDVLRAPVGGETPGGLPVSSCGGARLRPSRARGLRLGQPAPVAREAVCAVPPAPARSCPARHP